MKKLILNTNMKIFLSAAACLVSALALIKFPQLSADGIRTGLEICAGTMIPSLFPFLVVSSFAVSSGVSEFFGRKTDKFFRKIFKMSGNAGGVIFFGLWGGFPVGSSMAAALISQNRITKNEAKRIVLSSVNAGPAFVIVAVGTMMLSSFKAGMIMYFSLTISSLIISFLSQFIIENDGEVTAKDVKPTNFSEAFVSAVYSSSKSMLSICAWILIFSCFLNIASSKISSDTASSFLKSVCEVSLGSTSFSSSKNPALLSAIIGWGGLCVHCQVLPHVIKTGLQLRYFFCARLLHSMLAAIISTALLKIFPCEISVFSNGCAPVMEVFAVSAPAAAGLLIMCVIFILDLDSHKKMC